MMRWWLDRGVDGFRMDVINMISKDPALPDGRPLESGPLADGSEHYIGGPRIHEFLQEMHREVFAGRDAALLTVGEMPGVTVEEARLFTDPAARRARHGVPVRARQPRPERRRKWDYHPLRLRDLKAVVRPLAGGAGRARLEQPVLEQPRPAARRLALRRRRRAPRALGEAARHRPAPAPRHAVRLPGRGARDDERAVRRRSRTSATSSRSTTTRRRSPAATRPRRC